MKLMKETGEERLQPPATKVLEDVLQLARQDVPAILILFDEVLMFVRSKHPAGPRFRPIAYSSFF